MSPTLSTELDECYINRVVERLALLWIPLRDGIMYNLPFYMMWSASLVLALLGLCMPLYASARFHATCVLLSALKAPLGDMRCAGRHAKLPQLNLGLNLCLSGRERLWRNTLAFRAPLPLFAFYLGMCKICAATTLYRTFAHGYQIFPGSPMGLASHNALERCKRMRCDLQGIS